MHDVERKKLNYPHYVCFAIVDRDFDNRYLETQHLFFTDSTDLETLLFSSNSFSFKDAGFNDSQLRSMYCECYQIGHIRKASYRYIQSLNQTNRFSRVFKFRDLFDRDIIRNNKRNIYKSECDISLDDLLFYFCSKQDILFKLVSIPDIKKGLTEKMPQGIVDSDGRFIKPNIVEGFDYQKIKNYWNKVNGHDFQDAAEAINLDFAIEYRDYTKLLIERFKIQNFKNTKLYKKINNAKPKLT